MAISIVASGTTSVPAGSTSISITFTTAAQAGDHIYLSFQTQLSTGFTSSGNYDNVFGNTGTSGLVYWDLANSPTSSAAFTSFSTATAARLSYIIVRGVQQAYPALATTATATATSLATTAITYVTGTSYTVIDIWSFRATNTTINTPTGLTTGASANSTTAIPGAYIGYESNVTTANTTARTLTYGVSTAGQAVSIVLVDDTSPYYVDAFVSKASTLLFANYRQFQPTHKLIASYQSNAGTPTPTISTGNANVTSTNITSVGTGSGNLYAIQLNNTSGTIQSGQLQISLATANLMSLILVGIPVNSSFSAVNANNSGGASTTTPTVTVTGLSTSTNYLGIGIVGANGPSGDAFTQASGWINLERIGTTGGSATTNATISSGFDFILGISSLTYNPTLGTARTWGALVLVYTRGTIQTSTITESVTAVDSETAGLGSDVSITESALATDTQDATGAEQVIESVTATDSETAIYTAVRTITETGTATDTETAIFTTNSSITETGTATETENAGVGYIVVDSETVTATETQVGGILFTSAITETGTANDSETALNTARGYIDESTPGTLISTLPYFANAVGFGGAVLNPSQVASGATFIANITNSIGQVRVGSTFFTGFGTSTPTTVGTVELWQLTSNSITALPQTLLASVPYPYPTVSGGGRPATLVDFTGVSGANVVAGTGYGLVFRRGADWGSTGFATVVITDGSRFSNIYASIEAQTNKINYVTGASADSISAGTAISFSLEFADTNESTQTGGFVSTSAITETGTATETENAGVGYIVVDSETVTATETQVGSYNPAALITETGTATETETAVFAPTAMITETAPATETETALNTANAVITETGTATETETAVYTPTATITESAPATEEQLGGFDAFSVITETGTATETETAVYTPTAIITETGTATDTETAIFTTNSSITETAPATETETAIFTTSTLITESVTALNTQITTLVATADITELVTATNTQTSILNYNTAITESINAIVTSVVYVNFVANITESIDITDSYFALGWFRIDNTQPNAWAQIQNIQSTNWTQVNNSQPTNWVDIDDTK